MTTFAIAASLLFLFSLPICMRPLFIHRGLTRAQWLSNWPGDDAVAEARISGSRAIVINAPAENVWPWLTQIGQDRAGFYSYRWLENLVRAEMPDIRHIVPKWSKREKGQSLVMAPTSRFGSIATMQLVEAVEYRHLIFSNREGAWAFILEPMDNMNCRLVFRGTWIPSRSLVGRAARVLLFDPIHYIMEWKMARTIKQLAESSA